MTQGLWANDGHSPSNEPPTKACEVRVNRLQAIGSVLLVAGALLGNTAMATDRRSMDQRDDPRLLLFLMVDQARADYLQRFQPLFSDGLKFLLDRAVWFTNAHHDHANTSTAPGHASPATGVHPARSGIVANEWYSKKSRSMVYSVGDRRHSRSPRNLLVSGLADWIKARDPNSRVFAASVKDRSAVLIAGHQADAAYWYNQADGRWVSSSYYPSAAPSWLKDFNQRNLLERYFGNSWEPLPVDPAKAQGLGIENSDQLDRVGKFQRAIGGPSLLPDKVFYSRLPYTPFLDLHLVRLAEAMIESEQLGRDSSLDFLGLSFAVLDYVGHETGPDSPEVLDVLLRLDGYLGELFRTLDRTIGMERVVVSLSSDHGIPPLPEIRQRHGQPGFRVGGEDKLCVQEAGRKLQEGIGTVDWLLADVYLELYLNDEALAGEGLSGADVEARLARLLAACRGIDKVWTRTDMQSDNPSQDSDPLYTLYRNNYHPDRSPDVMPQLHPYFVPDEGPGTTHGSPHSYDTHVPLILLAPGVAPRQISQRVHTVDLAATLASLLHLPAPDNLDGVDRSPLLHAAP